MLVFKTRKRLAWRCLWFMAMNTQQSAASPPNEWTCVCVCVRLCLFVTLVAQRCQTRVCISPQQMEAFLHTLPNSLGWLSVWPVAPVSQHALGTLEALHHDPCFGLKDPLSFPKVGQFSVLFPASCCSCRFLRHIVICESRYFPLCRSQRPFWLLSDITTHFKVKWFSSAPALQTESQICRLCVIPVLTICCKHLSFTLI